MGERIENLLPEEIIEEIMYKLPVRSLLRFKCVSKRWRFVISSKRFVREHLKKKSTSTDNSDVGHHHHVLYSHQHCHYYFGSDSLRSIFHEPDCTESSSSLNLQSLAVATFSKISDVNRIMFLGSCNGLILISPMNQGANLFMWNPATRQAKKIPPPSFSNEQEAPTWPLWCYFSHGFGYDESTDDHKVVSIYTDLKPYQTRIYSSKTGSWKKIAYSEQSFLVVCGSYGKFVNGRLHWMVVKEEGNNKKWDILSLDLVDERYERVGGLENLSDIGNQPNVTDLSGYLSLISLTLVFGTDTAFKINIWVMMKYGEPQSWAKIWKLEDSVPHTRVPHAMPLWLLKNGDLAVALGSGVAVYNGQDKLRKSPVQVRNCKIDSAIYFESLVSPFEHRQ